MKHPFSSFTVSGLVSVLSGLIVPRKFTAEVLERLPTTLETPPREIELPPPRSPTKDETEDIVFVTLKHNHMRSIDTSDAVVVAVSDENTKIEPFCSLCETSKERPVPFHFCVRNPVVEGPYRTKFGPIERPNKNRISHAT
ncbi:hypothetical protein QJS04_geneDACA011684 [Acorus gramineus]|uniref:Uncharacterized protein n=1 Tax=Acorus gramineus TaxID=55184 RepID=A0AAV9BHS8_ACOGR|nr:hypothetical protein QJS04_geneDACA011684 [Acorus gramineus]